MGTATPTNTSTNQHTTRNSLLNDRGLFCVDGETTPQNYIPLFDDGLYTDAEAGDNIYTRGCISICPGVLDEHDVLEECYNCGHGAWNAP